MTITAGGNVGIGTTSPDYTLDIEATQAIARLKSTSSTSNLWLDSNRTAAAGADLSLIRTLYNGTLVAYILTEASTAAAGKDDSEMAFFTKKTGNAIAEAMRIDDEGNVGIGTTSPLVGLHQSSNGNTRFAVESTANDGGFSSIVSSGGSGTSNTYFTWKDGGQLNLGHSEDVLGSTFNSRMVIDSSGNVGIGTASPGNLLEVYKNTTTYSTTSYNPNAQLSLTTPNENGDFSGIRFSNNIGSREAFFGVTQTTEANKGDFVFQGYDGVALAYKEYMRIDNTGKVGINETSPTATLDVGGSIAMASGKEIRNIFTYSNNTTPTVIHIKTSWPTNNDAMYRFSIEGYAYGAGKEIHSTCGGYLYSTINHLYNNWTNDYADGATLTQYKSSDGYLVLKLVPVSGYYVGFGVSLQQYNPIYRTPPTFTVSTQAADL